MNILIQDYKTISRLKLVQNYKTPENTATNLFIFIDSKDLIMKNKLAG